MSKKNKATKATKIISKKETDIMDTSTIEAPIIKDVNAEEEKRGKKGAPKKKDFDVSKALDAEGNPIALDDNGRLTGIPDNWEARRYSILGIRQFSSTILHAEWELYSYRKRATERIKILEENVKVLREGGTPVRKLAKRAEQMKAELARILATLAEEGIEI